MSSLVRNQSVRAVFNSSVPGKTANETDLNVHMEKVNPPKFKYAKISERNNNPPK